VLDNFGHLLVAGPSVAALAAACPSLRVLVTSRALLRVYGEQEYALPPLALPGPGEPPTPDRLGEFAAIRLFVERARASQPSFALTEQNAAAVAQICRRLDGLPLAIELAAARVKLLPPPAILSRLERRLPALAGGARDLPERHCRVQRNSGMEWRWKALLGRRMIAWQRKRLLATTHIGPA
jgi:predicted ATPase